MEGGLDALTFQAIGDKLQAHPTSIYRHFRDKDELILELVDSLRARSYADQLVPSDDWLDDIRRLSQLIREHYLRYPQFAQQMAMRTTRRPTEFANVEFFLDAVHRGGISDAQAVVLLRAFGNLVRAMASLEAAFSSLEDTVRVKDELAWQLEYRHLDPERYPNITRVADQLHSIGDPLAFDTALEMMLSAIGGKADGDTS